jgi:hypothetical protein
MPAKDFQDIIVWQKAHQLVLSMYRFSNNFPPEEAGKLLEAYTASILNSGS